VVFAVGAWLVAIAAFAVLGVLAISVWAAQPEPGLAPWFVGFVVLLISLIGTGFVLTLKDGDRNMRNYLSYSIVLWGFNLSLPGSWKWLILLVPILLIGPLWLPRARRFFDEDPDGLPSPAGGTRAPDPPSRE
jgi:hypothetical protein